MGMQCLFLRRVQNFKIWALIGLRMWCKNLVEMEGKIRLKIVYMDVEYESWIMNVMVFIVVVWWHF
jgi:hypothetical protein